ncbi:MAG: histidine phosphatase family protein [Candidatus Omnitrophica bacterium]|nr:histidine phosphatase family protein [Candidatus Omnitrophota bacterium]
MRLYLVRHGESAWNQEDKVQGHTDIPLSDAGRRQARLVAERFTGRSLSRIYSSDLKRASETAQEIAAVCGAELILDERLREIRLGAWEGKTKAEIDKIFSGAYTRWLEDPASLCIEEAETRPEFFARVRSVLTEIIEAHKNDTALCIVAHGGVITAYLSLLLGADFDRMLFTMRLDNCGITTLEITDHQRTILTINDVFHLPEPDEIKPLF